MLLRHRVIKITFFRINGRRVSKTLVFLIILTNFTNISGFRRNGGIRFLNKNFMPSMTRRHTVRGPFYLCPGVLHTFFSLAFNVHCRHVCRLRGVFLTTSVRGKIMIREFFRIGHVRCLGTMTHPLRRLPTLGRGHAFQINWSMEKVGLR